MYLQSLRALTDGRELHTMQGVFEAQEYNAAAAFDPNRERVQPSSSLCPL